MSKVSDILPKKIKFKKFEKRNGMRSDSMAISVPENKSYGCYVNSRFARYLHNKEIGLINIYVDPQKETLGIEPTTDAKSGYRLAPTGIRGFQVNAKLGTVMPCGRYVYVPEVSTDELLVFSREYSSHSLNFGKRRNNGSN